MDGPIAYMFVGFCVSCILQHKLRKINRVFLDGNGVLSSSFVNSPVFQETSALRVD